jgi:sarcosine oxidase, subunit alpha
MTQLSRLPRLGRIDRAAPILFTFNGQVLEGYRGDTAASALLANGIHHVARSFKYHRPRGVLAAGSEEPNALLALADATRTIARPWSRSLMVYGCSRRTTGRRLASISVP